MSAKPQHQVKVIHQLQLTESFVVPVCSNRRCEHKPMQCMMQAHISNSQTVACDACPSLSS